jgi:molecular chaperone DnaK
MVKQAEEFAEADRERAALIEAKNKAESLAYEAERLISDSKEKLSESEIATVKEKVGALRTVLEAKDATLPRIQTASDDLTRSLHAISQKLYQSTPPTGAASGTPSDTPSEPRGSESPTSPGGPVDADFKVVDQDSDEEKGPS